MKTPTGRPHIVELGLRPLQIEEQELKGLDPLGSHDIEHHEPLSTSHKLHRQVVPVYTLM